MIPPREANESTRDQPGSIYSGYEGDQEYARQHSETSYEQMQREELEGKIYPPQRGNISMFYQFVISITLWSLTIAALYAAMNL